MEPIGAQTWQISLIAVYVLFLSFAVSGGRSLPIELTSASIGLLLTAMLTITTLDIHQIAPEYGNELTPLILNFAIVIFTIILAATILTIMLFKVFQEVSKSHESKGNVSIFDLIRGNITYALALLISSGSFVANISAFLNIETIAVIVYRDGIGGLFDVLDIMLLPHWWSLWWYFAMFMMAVLIGLRYNSTGIQLFQALGSLRQNGKTQ